MANRLEQLAEDIMNLSQDEVHMSMILIHANLMPDVERQRGLLAE